MGWASHRTGGLRLNTEARPFLSAASHFKLNRRAEKSRANAEKADPVRAPLAR